MSGNISGRITIKTKTSDSNRRHDGQTRKSKQQTVMKKVFSKELTIGVTVIVAILILVFGIDYLKGVNLFKPANFYVAAYDNVQGLELSAPVVIDGYKVGQVREIKFNYEKPGKIDVILALDKKLQLPDNSVAVIGSTLLSGAFVEIMVGDSHKMLTVGGDIKTAVKPDLMANVSEQLMPSVNSILPKFDSIMSHLDNLIADPALAQSIRRLDGITDNIMAVTGGLKATVGRDLPVLTGGVRPRAAQLDTITRNLGLLSQQLKALPIQSTMNNVNTATDNLARFSNQLNDRNSSLGQLMYDDDLYRRINSVTANIDSLIVDIKRNPKRYISIKLL